MAKKDNSLAGLTKVCNEMLRASEKYSYLWDDNEIWKENENDERDYEDDEEKLLHITGGFIAQDETFSIYIRRTDKNKFVFDGENFCKNEEKDGINARQAARRIKYWYGRFTGMTADELRKDFYDSLKKPLGRYLAKKGLEKIKF